MPAKVGQVRAQNVLGHREFVEDGVLHGGNNAVIYQHAGARLSRFATPQQAGPLEDQSLESREQRLPWHVLSKRQHSWNGGGYLVVARAGRSKGIHTMSRVRPATSQGKYPTCLFNWAGRASQANYECIIRNPSLGVGHRESEKISKERVRIPQLFLRVTSPAACESLNDV